MLHYDCNLEPRTAINKPKAVIPELVLPIPSPGSEIRTSFILSETFLIARSEGNYEFSCTSLSHIFKINRELHKIIRSISLIFSENPMIHGWLVKNQILTYHYST